MFICLLALLFVENRSGSSSRCVSVRLSVCSVSRPSHLCRGTSPWFRCSWCSLWEAWRTFSGTWWGLQTHAALPRSWCWKGRKYPSEQSGSTYVYMSQYTNMWSAPSMHLRIVHLSTSARFSPSLSSLTLCPPLTGGTSQRSGFHFLRLSLKHFLLNAGMMFCIENSRVKCIAAFRSLTALGETLALTPLYWLII